ncbi:MAG: hypothetical protein HC780_23105 [Leptolyngbyaceae cyanobacterium CSU_1_3]|nr:hypothetical protein [Leptolyngbyaceae cyanobacterium CSU_1_3]
MPKPRQIPSELWVEQFLNHLSASLNGGLDRALASAESAIEPMLQMLVDQLSLALVDERVAIAQPSPNADSGDRLEVGYVASAIGLQPLGLARTNVLFALGSKISEASLNQLQTHDCQCVWSLGDFQGSIGWLILGSRPIGAI